MRDLINGEMTVVYQKFNDEKTNLQKFLDSKLIEQTKFTEDKAKEVYNYAMMLHSEIENMEKRVTQRVLYLHIKQSIHYS